MKQLIYLLLAISITAQLFGQEEKNTLSPKFLWGITVAPGLSKINTKFIEQPDRNFYDYKSSFQFSSSIGIVVQKQLKNNILLESGLLYSTIRGNESYNYKEGYGDPLQPYYSTYKHIYVDYSKTTLKYIHLPFLIGYSYKKVSIFTGFQIGYNISAYNEDRGSLIFIIPPSTSFGSESDIDVPKYSFDGIFKFNISLGKGWLMGTRFYYQLTENTFYTVSQNYFGANLSLQYMINYKN